MSLTQRVLAPIVDVRKEEAAGAVLMFSYSFLAMTAYNIIKPITRSKFIFDLGADNLPYVLLAAGLIIGVLMTGYSWLVARLPRRGALPITQLGMAALLFGFWFLFQNKTAWASTAFYVLGAILGVLLISQFWTVANLVYDPRQAKRLFGFVGGGASLGGIVGSEILIRYTERIGTTNMLLISGTLLVTCAALTWMILRRAPVDPGKAAEVKQERGVGATEAFQLLRRSKHLQIIALVISLAAVGAGIIDQQLSTAAAAAKGSTATDSITIFLGRVQQWTSILGFVIQIWLTSKIHRYLGIGFALMVLPISLGSTAVVMLMNAALWAPSLARVADQSLRYTVDKTTREILFLPLPEDLKLKAKSFVDVTVDRGAKALGALLLLVLVKPWGFNLDWQQLSYASLAVTAVWIFMALRAKRGYLTAFRRSIERRDLEPAELRLNAADLSTIETLVQELAHPDARRVIYAIDMLESLDKRNLVTPLLLYHEEPAVRARALRALAAGSDQSARWTPQIRRALSDSDAAVRAEALRALATAGHQDASGHARPLLADPDPRIRATAALALAVSGDEADRLLAHEALAGLMLDTDAVHARRDAARALGDLPDPRFRRLLVALLHDPDAETADAAMESVRRSGAADFLFVPALATLLRNRQLKGRARDTLAGYGEPVIDVLAHFMRDPDEDLWLRRHLPTTLARIVSQRSVDALLPALKETDGFLRYKTIAALERLRRADPGLRFDRATVEPAILRDARAFYESLSLHYNLFVRGKHSPDSLLARALDERLVRVKDRIFRLLSLIFPWDDIAAAQWTLTRGDSRSRASASEYLDNVLGGQLRQMVMPIVEDLPLDEKVRRANVVQRTRVRDVEETLLQLINDDDQVIAAVAIDEVRRQRLWTLAGDIEHVLQYRDVRDWYVFESASWALAEQRMPAERRRELWLEPLPAAVLADRLRALPLFRSVSVDELFRIASASRQVRHETGATLLTEGAVPHTIHLLLDGTVVAMGSAGEPERIAAPAALGFAEALEGMALSRSIRTSGMAVTLALTTDQLRTLLADNTELVRGLFAEMSQTAEGSGCGPVQSTGAAADLERLAQDGIVAIEKILALQFVPHFARLSASETQQLAAITHTVPMKAGATLFTAASPPATWLIVSGDVRLDEPGGATVMARGGDVIGTFCALSGREVGRTASALSDGIALRIGRDELFELLGERPDLLRQLFGGMMDLSRRSAAV